MRLRREHVVGLAAGMAFVGLVLALRARAAAEERRRESGLPGGGRGRKDEITRRGLWPFSVRRPAGVEPEGEIRPPGSVVRAPYDESGRSEMSMFRGTLVGSTPPNGPSEGPREPRDED